MRNLEAKLSDPGSVCWEFRTFDEAAWEHIIAIATVNSNKEHLKYWRVPFHLRDVNLRWKIGKEHSMHFRKNTIDRPYRPHFSTLSELFLPELLPYHRHHLQQF